jgi:fatty acid CoA ligase FadD9
VRGLMNKRAPISGLDRTSFYEVDTDGNRQRAHFEGLPVEFIAEAISTLGAQVVNGFQTYHVWNPDDDGIGLDEYVDWLIQAGYSIQRIPDYAEWLQRFETVMRALPDQQRQASLLPLLQYFQQPERPVRGSLAPTDRFRTAVQEAKIGPGKDIPQVTPAVIVKYITDLRLLGLL